MSALSPRTASLDICVAMLAGCHRGMSRATSLHVVNSQMGLLCACLGIHSASSLSGWSRLLEGNCSSKGSLERNKTPTRDPSVMPVPVQKPAAKLLPYCTCGQSAGTITQGVWLGNWQVGLGLFVLAEGWQVSTKEQIAVLSQKDTVSFSQWHL